MEMSLDDFQKHMAEMVSELVKNHREAFMINFMNETRAMYKSMDEQKLKENAEWVTNTFFDYVYGLHAGAMNEATFRVFETQKINMPKWVLTSVQKSVFRLMVLMAINIQRTYQQVENGEITIIEPTTVVQPDKAPEPEAEKPDHAMTDQERMKKIARDLDLED